MLAAFFSSLVFCCFSSATVFAQRIVREYRIDPQTSDALKAFEKSLLWDGTTNGVMVGLLPPAKGAVPAMSLYLKALDTNALWRWVLPTNDVPCKVELLDDKQNVLVPTNMAIKAAESLPSIVRLADYPPLPRRVSSRRYLRLYVDQPYRICDIELTKYYDLSKGGKFIVRITPLLYGARPELGIARLSAFPQLTYELDLPPQTASPGCTVTP